MKMSPNGSPSPSASNDAWFGRLHGAVRELRVAYFSAEFAVAQELRIYAGGLGVLDTGLVKEAWTFVELALGLILFELGRRLDIT